MVLASDESQDVMQVCRNGHVITERLRSDPESSRSHCDRCGAITFHDCPTCGYEFPGARQVPGLTPVGMKSPPNYCQVCGAALPWVRKRRFAPEPLATLETMLRRLPLVITQLRWRQTEQPPFRVEDERDLEDLLRALLPLRFDDVRLERRTPSYSPRNRTDFVLAAEKIALTAKYARPGFNDARLWEQWKEDAAYYRERGGCLTLVGYVYDPEGVLREPSRTERVAGQSEEKPELRCIISGIC